MGDFIEGPIEGRHVVYASANKPRSLTAVRDREEGKKKGNSSIWLIVGGLLAGSALTQGIIMMADRSNAEKSFSRLVDARCYMTPVGAKGLVESSNARARTVTMIFPSGLRETYYMSNLSEVPCATVSDSATTQHQEGE